MGISMLLFMYTHEYIFLHQKFPLDIELEKYFCYCFQKVQNQPWRNRCSFKLIAFIISFSRDTRDVCINVRPPLTYVIIFAELVFFKFPHYL